MPKFFAASTGGFYWDEDARPADAVEISDDLHAQLLEGQTAGGQIVAGEDGFPRLSMPPPVPENVRLQRALSARLKAEYDAAIAAGMPWAGHTLQIDDASQARLTAMVAMAQHGLPEGFAWRMADNAMVPLDAEGLLAMALAAGAHVYRLRADMWAALDQVRDATSLKALRSIEKQMASA